MSEWVQSTYSGRTSFPPMRFTQHLQARRKCEACSLQSCLAAVHLNVWDGSKLLSTCTHHQPSVKGTERAFRNGQMDRVHALLVSSLGSTIVAAATTKDGSEGAPVQPAGQVAAILPLNALQVLLSITEVPPELFSRNLFVVRELLQEVLRRRKQSSEFRPLCVGSREALRELKHYSV